MGYCILTYPDGTREILGDVNQARKAEGLSHYREGKKDREIYISSDKIEEMDFYHNGEERK